MIIRKFGAFVKIVGSPLNDIRKRTTTTRDEVRNARLLMALVIMDVPCTDKNARVNLLRFLSQIVPQREFVWTRIMIYQQMRLDVCYRRMVNCDHQKIHRAAHAVDLFVPTILPARCPAIVS